MPAQRLSATQAAIISMNVPHRHLMDEVVFDGLLAGTIPVVDWKCHLEILFSDVPKYLLGEILLEKHINLSTLADVYFKLPDVYQSKSFKEFLNANMGSAV